MVKNPLEQMFVRMDNAHTEEHVTKMEFEELKARYQDLKDRLHGLSASVAEDRALLDAAHDREAFEQGTRRNLALQLGEAILSSSFCTFNKRTRGDEVITRVDVTLFRPGKKGTKEGGN